MVDDKIQGALAPEPKGAKPDEGKRGKQSESPKTQDKKRSVIDLARETGNARRVTRAVNFGGSASAKVLEFSAAHAIASQLHGWDAHRMSTGAEYECMRDAYLKALAAAVARPEKRAAPPPPPKPIRGRRSRRNSARPVRPVHRPYPGATSEYAPFRKFEVTQ